MSFVRRGLRVPLAVAALALVAVPAVTANASGTDPNSLVPVATGINAAALPNVIVFGATPAATPETVSFVLRENNANQLANQVTSGSTNFVSVSQFAQRYGQSPHNVLALVNYLAGFGITSQVYPDNIDVSATGTAGEFDAALATHQEDLFVPAIHGHSGATVPSQHVHANSTDPYLPDRLAQFVTAILGLSNYAPFATDLTHASSAVKMPAALDTTTCEALTGVPSACNLPSDFVSRYGLSKVAAKANGSGSTIGIVTLAALNVGAPEYFWSNVAGIPDTGRTVSVENIDGGPGAPSEAAGSSETDLDVEQSGGVAPGANVVVYQAPNTDNGFADAFFTAASENVASSVSASWGESETILQVLDSLGLETPAYQQAFDEAFLELGAQGQSTFASAGDAGAYDATGDAGTTNLAVDTPASSPYITAAGGTTLPWSATLTGVANATVSVPAERAWGWDYLWAPVATINGLTPPDVFASLLVGGGGGYSTQYNTPSYQQGVPGVSRYLGVTNLISGGVTSVGGVNLPTTVTLNPTPTLVKGHGQGRAVPDLSADADPETGYLEYSPSFADTGGALLEGGWGGTSFVAPQLNGSAAVIDSYVGHRVGLWNPTMYAAATSQNSPFTTLSSAGTGNDNLFYTGQPGTVFNPATGLGTPNLSALAKFFSRSEHGGFGY